MWNQLGHFTIQSYSKKKRKESECAKSVRNPLSSRVLVMKRSTALKSTTKNTCKLGFISSDETHKYTCRVVKEQEEELQANNLMIDFNQQPHIDTPKRKIELLDSKWRVQDYKKNRELVIQSLCHNKEDLIQGVQSIYNRQM